MAYFGGVKSERFALRGDSTGMLVLAALGVCAAVLMIAYSGGVFKNLPAALAPRSETSSVAPASALPSFPIVTMDALVAANDVKIGERLTPELFVMKPVEVSNDEYGRALISDWKAIFAQYAKTPLREGQPLLQSQMSDAPPTNEITAKIPAGFRAVTISVDGEGGVEGWVRPGAKVDVVWTTNQLGRALISTIVERAEVLSVERSLDKENKTTGKAASRSFVTLLASTKDTQRIQLAKTSGTLSLNLRGDEDDGAVGSETITIDRLVKRNSLRVDDDAAGTVTMGGETFVFRNGKLMRPEEAAKLDKE